MNEETSLNFFPHYTFWFIVFIMCFE